MAASAVSLPRIHPSFENRDPALSQSLGIARFDDFRSRTNEALNAPILNNLDTTFLNGQASDQRWGAIRQIHPATNDVTGRRASAMNLPSAGPSDNGHASMSSTSVSPQQLQFDFSNRDFQPELPQPSVLSEDRMSTPQPSQRLQRIASKESETSTTQSSKDSSAEAAAASDRSERARNAANRRHSRAKENKPTDGRRTSKDIEREKNRIAAAKCRKKKRAMNNTLDIEYRAASAANSLMKLEHRDLRDQLTFFRMLALQHMNNGQNGCQCHAIQQYNNSQAMKAICEMESGRNGNLCSD